MTCPHCGARNTAAAPWCTQCLQPLGPAEAAPAEADPDEADPDEASPPDARPTATSSSRAFRTVDGEVEWRCRSCDTWNRLETRACTVCGAALGASVTGSTGTEVAERVARARRLLWVAAGIGAVLMVVSIVLLVLALRTGTGG